MKKEKNIALVLSGGAARGIAHIGVIEALLERGYIIHAISGTSMGALIGGVYALGKLDEFKAWLLALDKMKILKLLDFTFSSPGLIKGNKILEKIKSFIPERNIESLDIKFTAIATDINRNKTIIFDTGSIFDAIRASVSIPALFSPVIKDGTILVDGGVLNNIPINHVARIPFDILVASHVNAYIPVPKAFKADKHFVASNNKHLELKAHIKKHFKKEKTDKMGYFDIIYKSMFLPIGELSAMRLKQFPPDILIQIPHEICGLFDFLQAERLIAIGRISTNKKIDLFNSTLK